MVGDGSMAAHALWSPRGLRRPHSNYMALFASHCAKGPASCFEGCVRPTSKRVRHRGCSQGPLRAMLESKQHEISVRMSHDPGPSVTWRGPLIVVRVWPHFALRAGLEERSSTLAHTATRHPGTRMIEVETTITFRPAFEPEMVNTSVQPNASPKHRSATPSQGPIIIPPRAARDRTNVYVLGRSLGSFPAIFSPCRDDESMELHKPPLLCLDLQGW
ncbi:hypothetical protein SODALDRAFT_358520 [Sodiomyces alkalinus F11]|uniref:Uncharacterized protein n=1 Tax=Sodiomyces alkalinus (strain CBS 110278 / VKM F-3762 / F11) TaxID=1314773 RepID=A0A3N2Q013_SODAK|nr:hypothetical protein SODALDRAFT_358520 [Sodiomyces alkalinus F11]ROT40083.1 hypothetical protein SODALDRAFT_358520 [Sodiomyces alkalinus F11]